jgi:hypothetical protein
MTSNYKMCIRSAGVHILLELHQWQWAYNSKDASIIPWIWTTTDLGLCGYVKTKQLRWVIEHVMRNFFLSSVDLQLLEGSFKIVCVDQDVRHINWSHILVKFELHVAIHLYSSLYRLDSSRLSVALQCYSSQNKIKLAHCRAAIAKMFSL